MTATLVLDLVTGALVVLGGLFFLAGTVGLLRFPDIYCRLHALTKADNLGLGLVALAMAIRSASIPVAVQIGAIWLLALGAAATVCHLLARSALDEGVPAVGEGGEGQPALRENREPAS